MQERQSCCSSTPGASHSTDPSPASAPMGQRGDMLSPTVRDAAFPLQYQSSGWSQRPWWSFHRFSQLWLSPRGTRFPMTHSAGQGEIIGKVVSVALSMKQRRLAGPGCRQELRRHLQTEHLRQAGCYFSLLAPLPAAPLEHRNGSLGACTESCPSRAARRETGSRGRGWGQPRERAGNVVLAELITDGVAALGKGDMGSRVSRILPQTPDFLRPHWS